MDRRSEAKETAPSAGPSDMSTLTRMPPLLYGTAWKAEATTALVLQALASGFRGLDVAGQPKHYREDLVGEAVLHAARDLGIPREALWIQTKFTSLGGQDRNKPLPYDGNAPVRTAVRQSFHTSLRNLHQGPRWIWDEGEAKGDGARARPWIDSYLLHSPLDTLEATVEAWEAMEDLVVEGKVRQIGFSNVYDPRIFAVLRSAGKRVGPRILQNRWHHTSGHDVSLLPLLSPSLSPNDFPLPGASSGQGIIYQPFWTLTGNPRLLSSEGVIRSAIKHDWTPQQVVYRFVAQGFGVKGIATAVLCGSTDEAHMREAVHVVLGEEALDDNEVDEIRRGIYGE